MKACYSPIFIKGSKLSEGSELSPEEPKEPLIQRPQIPDSNFLTHILEARGNATPEGDLARAILRDPCFPKVPASYFECVSHVEEAHSGKTDILDLLFTLWFEWRERWLALWQSHGLKPYSEPPKYPPRQNILEAAQEAEMVVTANEMTFCWNDVPESPTQGHFNGNREPSMKLYTNDQSFFCHQCGIWGYSDQLLKRTWQGKAR